jgi:hypothetical protein
MDVVPAFVLPIPNCGDCELEREGKITVVPEYGCTESFRESVNVGALG